MKQAGFIAAALLMLCFAGRAHAVPFDVIVPEEITVDTSAPQVGVCFHHWGWIIATDEPITQLALDTGSLYLITDSTSVTVSQTGFTNTFVVAPLDAGDVAGVRLDPENAAAYDSLLILGETLVDPTTTLVTTEILFSSDYAETVTVSGGLFIDGHELTYTTRIIFGSFGPIPTVTRGQRISATAIPVTTSPTTWGDLKSRFLPSRQARPPAR